jgi:hypothetical protein
MKIKRESDMTWKTRTLQRALCLTAALTAFWGSGTAVLAQTSGPAPSQWSGSTEVLEYLGELTFSGPNLTTVPPLGPEGKPMIGRVDGGRATGPVLQGEILPAGEDWAILRPDGSLDVNLKLLLKTDDGAYVKIRYEARWKGKDETRLKILSGQPVEPTEYYLRSAPFFETLDPRYAWLNNIIAVGYGRVERGAGVTMRIYRLK